MSGLGELMLDYGYRVSGSDIRCSPLTDRLAGLGATVYTGHGPRNVDGADLVVYSAAIPSDNPELSTARRQGLATVSRADLLGALALGKQGIAVAGTHGKTSTAAMIVKVLSDAGLDPTAAIGGVMSEYGSNVRRGRGSWMVLEADEYDRSFHTLAPKTAVITSVDADHLEYYGSQEAIDEAFVEFTRLVPAEQPLIVCADDPGVRRVSPSLPRRLTTYGRAPGAVIRVEAVAEEGWQVSGDVYIRDRQAGRLTLPQPGECNLLNALAAIGVADQLDIPAEVTMAALAGYRGLQRRFEVLGDIAGIRVVDDYAHHPTEIEAATHAVSKAGYKRIFVVFQPHLYSRTQNLGREFGRVLARCPAYRVLVTDVFPSRETTTGGVSGELIVKASREFGGKVEYIPKKDRVAEAIAGELEDGDLVLTLGAGDIDTVGRQIVGMLERSGA